MGQLLLGAALAIAGGLIGQLVAFWLRQRELVRTHRRDKLDALMTTLYEDEHWIEDYRRAMCYLNGEHSTSEPFDRVAANVHLYFRDQLLAPFLALLQARTNYKEAMGLVYIDRLDRAMTASHPNVTTILPDQDKIEDVTAAHQSYYGAFLEIRSACVSAAKGL